MPTIDSPADGRGAKAGHTPTVLEALQDLVAAADEHCPSPLTDDPEVVAEARDLRRALKAARAAIAAARGEAA